MRIVIGVDGSPQGQVAAELTATLPLTADDEVIVVSVVPRQLLVGAWSYAHVPQAVELASSAQEVAARTAREAVEAAAAIFEARPCRVRKMTPEGYPSTTLPELVEEIAADLVVVGAQGAGRLEELVLGSVAEALLERLPASVLIARGRVGPPTRILLAYDGSPHSRAAARFLAKLPLPPEAEIQVLTATAGEVQPLNLDGGPLQGLEAAGAKVASEGAELLEAAGRRATPIVRPGQAKHAIVAAARELDRDLVVMGARGLGGIRGLILGSVSRAVSKAAPCSVLVVARREGEAE